MPLRAACVGAGWAGTTHMEAALEVPHAIRYTCIVDSDAPHLNETADRFGVKTRHTKLEDALRDPDVDAVDISAPHRLHMPMAVAAARAGKHVMVEKPMGMDVAECTAMIKAADSAGVALFVAENVAYEPRTQFMRAAVASVERIGQITSASVTAGFRAERGYAYPGRRAWLALPGDGGTGTWLLHGIHTLAGMRQVFGEFESIYMTEHRTTANPRQDVEGTLTALLTTREGVGVLLTQTSETKLDDALEGYTVHGERGTLRALRRGWRLYGGSEPSAVRPYPDAAANSYARELEAFAEMAAGGDVPTSGRSERRSMGVAEGGLRSLAQRRPVLLEEEFPGI
jgi:predicted dehydrogenase